MKSLMQKIFGQRTTQATANPSASTEEAQTPKGVASALENNDETQRAYEEFCRTFYIKPDQLFMNYLSKRKITRLVQWFHPSTREPEPKSFIKLANDATREGVQIWQQTSLQMYLHGRWDQGGGPSEESRICLSLLAQVLKLKIDLFFEQTEGGQMMKMTFEP